MIPDKLQSADQIAEKIFADIDQSDWLQMATAMQEASWKVRMKLKKIERQWIPQETDWLRCAACVRGRN